MAWTAIVDGVTKNEGNVVAAVRFVETETNETISRPVPAQTLTTASLADYCQRVIVGLEARDAAVALIVTGPVVLPRDSKDPVVVEKITKAAAAEVFFALLTNYNNLQAQVAKGMLLGTDKAVVTAAEDMKAAFLPEYADDPRFR